MYLWISVSLSLFLSFLFLCFSLRYSGLFCKKKFFIREKVIYLPKLLSKVKILLFRINFLTDCRLARSGLIASILPGRKKVRNAGIVAETFVYIALKTFFSLLRLKKTWRSAEITTLTALLQQSSIIISP